MLTLGVKCKPRLGRPPKIPVGVDSEGFAPNLDVLAEECGVDRKTIDNARKRFARDAPKKRADGRYPLAEYKQWLAKHDVRGRGINNPSNAIDDGQHPKAYWDCERARVDFERAVLSLEIEKSKHVELDEMCAALGQMLVGFRTAINMLPGSAARWLIGLKDFHQIKTKLENEVDSVLQAPSGAAVIWKMISRRRS